MRRAQAAGLRLAAWARVLEIRDGGEAPCGQVTALLEEHLEDVRRRIAALRAAEAELVVLVDRAAEVEPGRCGPADVCEILAEERVGARPGDERPDRVRAPFFGTVAIVGTPRLSTEFRPT